jgi:acetolactate synthase I/II/III large subunit
MNVFDALASAMVAEGVSTAATVPDETTVFLAQALAEKGVRVIRPRHEQSAVLIADGYARASGEVGVCVIGSGPAIAQTGTAIVTAQRKRSPVLLFVAGTEPDLPGGQIKEFDLPGFSRALGVHYRKMRAAEELAVDVQRAFQTVRLRHEPVLVELPARSALLRATDHPVAYRPVPRPAAVRLDADAESSGVEEAAALLISARRPLIFAGRGVVEAARKEVLELADRLGALLATSLQARGLFDGHERDIGILGTFATDEASALLADTDCILAVGASLNPYQTGGRIMAAGARVIHIDQAADRIGGLSDVDLGIVGDAGAILRGIQNALERADLPPQAPWATETFAPRVQAAVSAWRSPHVAPAGDPPLKPSTVLAALDEGLPDSRFVVVDGGRFMYFVVHHIRVPGPRSWLWTLDFASIGLGLGMAIGAAAAGTGERCVLFVGDGGLAMSLQELETVVREGIPLTVVVLNNAAYAAETRMLRRHGKPPGLAQYARIDFAAVARALGAGVVSVRTAEDLVTATAEAGRAEGPLVIDAWVSEDEDPPSGPDATRTL